MWWKISFLLISLLFFHVRVSQGHYSPVQNAISSSWTGREIRFHHIFQFSTETSEWNNSEHDDNIRYHCALSKKCTSVHTVEVKRKNVIQQLFPFYNCAEEAVLSNRLKSLKHYLFLFHAVNNSAEWMKSIQSIKLVPFNSNILWKR